MIFVNLKISGPPIIQSGTLFSPQKKKRKNKCQTKKLHGGTPDLKMSAYGFLTILQLSSLLDVRKVTEIS